MNTTPTKTAQVIKFPRSAKRPALASQRPRKSRSKKAECLLHVLLAMCFQDDSYQDSAEYRAMEKWG